MFFRSEIVQPYLRRIDERLMNPALFGERDDPESWSRFFRGCGLGGNRAEKQNKEDT